MADEPRLLWRRLSVNAFFFWEASAVINSTQCGSLWHPLRLCMGTRIRTRLHGCIHGCIHLTRLNNSFHPVPSHAVCGLRAATCNFYGNLHFLPATGSPFPSPSPQSLPPSPLPLYLALTHRMANHFEMQPRTQKMSSFEIQTF